MKILPFVLSAYLSSCVTTHYRDPETAADGKLKISCSNPDWLTDQFGVVSCTFENMTQNWVDVQSSEIKISDSTNSNFSPLTAEQTHSFIKSYEFKRKQSDTNTDLVLTSLVIGGLAASLSSNANVSGVGLGVAGTSAAYGAGREVSRTIHGAQYPNYGEDHILGPNVSIPAGLFVRRSAIFEVRGLKRDIASVEICFTQPQVECIVTAMSPSRGARHRGY